MTPPKPSSRPDAVAIRTNHITFLYLGLRLSNAFGERNIERFDASYMVKVERRWVLFISAIHAARGHLVCVQPITDIVCALVGLQVNALPVSRTCKPRQSQFFLPLRRNLLPSVSRSRLAKRAADFCSPFRSKGLPANGAGECLRRGAFPRWHDIWIARNKTPCKPEIFAATYEAVP